MIRINTKILNRNYHYNIAVSGGVDSLTFLDFLFNGKWLVEPFFIDHGTEYSKQVLESLEVYLKKQYDMNLKVYTLPSLSELEGNTLEHKWSKGRRRIYDLMDRVIVCHHLNDQVETWLASCINGKPSLIKWISGNVYRPFLLTSKEDIYDYATNHDLKWLEDPTNHVSAGTRNTIRNDLMPTVRVVQPGIEKIVAKLIESERYMVVDND